MVGRGGTVDSSQRDYGELGAVEQVEPGSAVVDEGGLAVAWHGKVVDVCQSRDTYESKELSNLEATLELPLSNDNLQRRFNLDGSRSFNKAEGRTFEVS